MKVSNFYSQQNSLLRYSNNVPFGNNMQNITVKPDSSNDDSFVSKHKKEIAIGSAITGAMTLITIAVAYTRGKTVNTANGNESKLLSNISEGVKSFFGKSKEAYKTIINKKNNNPIVSLETVTVKVGDNVDKTDMAQTARSRINKIIKENDLSDNSIVGDVDSAVKDGLLSLDDEMLSAISDDVMMNLLTANGLRYYCGGVNFNILNNLKNIRAVYSPEQVKSLCENSPSIIIDAIKKAPEEFAKLATK